MNSDTVAYIKQFRYFTKNLLFLISITSSTYTQNSVSHSCTHNILWFHIEYFFWIRSLVYSGVHIFQKKTSRQPCHLQRRRCAL